MRNWKTPEIAGKTRISRYSRKILIPEKLRARGAINHSHSIMKHRAYGLDALLKLLESCGSNESGVI
jgi:hypothetical protein